MTGTVPLQAMRGRAFAESSMERVGIVARRSYVGREVPMVDELELEEMPVPEQEPSDEQAILVAEEVEAPVEHQDPEEGQ